MVENSTKLDNKNEFKETINESTILNTTEYKTFKYYPFIEEILPQISELDNPENYKKITSFLNQLEKEILRGLNIDNSLNKDLFNKFLEFQSKKEDQELIKDILKSIIKDEEINDIKEYLNQSFKNFANENIELIKVPEKKELKGEEKTKRQKTIEGATNYNIEFIGNIEGDSLQSILDTIKSNPTAHARVIEQIVSESGKKATEITDVDIIGFVQNPNNVNFIINDIGLNDEEKKAIKENYTKLGFSVEKSTQMTDGFVSNNTAKIERKGEDKLDKSSKLTIIKGMISQELLKQKEDEFIKTKSQDPDNINQETRQELLNDSNFYDELFDQLKGDFDNKISKIYLEKCQQGYKSMLISRISAFIGTGEIPQIKLDDNANSEFTMKSSLSATNMESKFQLMDGKLYMSDMFQNQSGIYQQNFIKIGDFSSMDEFIKDGGGIDFQDFNGKNSIQDMDQLISEKVNQKLSKFNQLGLGENENYKSISTTQFCKKGILDLYRPQEMVQKLNTKDKITSENDGEFHSFLNIIENSINTQNKQQILEIFSDTKIAGFFKSSESNSMIIMQKLGLIKDSSIGKIFDIDKLKELQTALTYPFPKYIGPQIHKRLGVDLKALGYEIDKKSDLYYMKQVQKIN